MKKPKPKTKKEKKPTELETLRDHVKSLKVTIESQDKIIAEMVQQQIQTGDIEAAKLQELRDQNLALQKSVERLEKVGKKTHWWN